MDGRVGRTRGASNLLRQKQLNITDSILIVNGNQQYPTRNVRTEIFPTTKPSRVLGEEAAGSLVVVSGAIVRWARQDGEAVPKNHRGGKRRVADFA